MGISNKEKYEKYVRNILIINNLWFHEYLIENNIEIVPYIWNKSKKHIDKRIINFFKITLKILTKLLPPVKSLE